MSEKYQIFAGGVSGTASSTYAMITGWIYVPDWLFGLIMALLAGFAGALGGWIFHILKTVIREKYNKYKAVKK